MDTSKNYYESVMQDFAMYARGRSLEQYCRDQAVDYKWLLKAQKQYGIPEKSKPTKTARRTKEKTPEETPEMIQLHFDPEENSDNIADKVAEIFRPEREAEVTQPNQARKPLILHLVVWRIITTFAPVTNFIDYGHIEELLRVGDARLRYLCERPLTGTVLPRGGG